MSSPAGAPIVVVAGPSGVGKGTVLAWVREQRPEVWVSVSATTRAPRPGEKDGINYHYLSPDQFDAQIAAGGFLEWAEYAGNRYGTPLQPVLDQQALGHPVLLEIELQGARQVRQRLPQALLVFVAPPSWEELVRRLTGRGTESAELVERRLATARQEMAAEAEFDVAIVNDTVESAGRALLHLLESASSK
jgi:guanylate kinase